MNQSNCMVAQSGGPTAAINASLAGVISGIKKSGKYDTCYGAINGILGILNERYLNLSQMIPDEKTLNRLKVTPAMYLGSCRHKLPDYKDDDSAYVFIFNQFAKLNIKAFFYIGGNDSMDTVLKLSDYAAKIKSDRTKAIVHRQTKSIPLDSSFIAQCPGNSFTQCNTRILDRMVFVDIEVALTMYREIHTRMTSYLVEHMVEKTDPSRYITPTVSIEIQRDIYIGLSRYATHLGPAFSREKKFRYPIPVIGYQGTCLSKSRRIEHFPHRLTSVQDTLATEITGQLHIGKTIAYDKRCRHIITPIEIRGKHRCPGFSGRKILLGK